MSALDWSLWLKAGGVRADAKRKQVLPGDTVYQAKLARAVKVGKLVAVHVADTTRSAECG